jgi:O-antigen/teichoic acid export membrane protein
LNAHKEKMNLRILLQKHSSKVLGIATVGALGLSFAGTMINSHQLDDTQFGDWKYLQSFVVLISYLVNFGLYSSGGRLVAATDNLVKIRTYKGYLMYFALAGLSVIILSLLICGFFFPKLLNQSLFHMALVMLPLFIIHPLGFYFESVYQGQKKLLGLAAYRLIPPFLYVVMLYAFKSYSKGNIYFSALLYYATSFVVCMVLLKTDKPIFKKNTSEWKDLKLQHKSFGVQLYWGGLWGVGVIYLLPILVGYFNINHSNKDVGHYSLALSFIMPLSILPSIVGTSNFKGYITAKSISKQSFKKVILACLALQVLLFLGIDWFIGIFLDAKYKDVGTLIKLGSFGAILHGFGDFVNKFLLAKGESKYMKKVSIAVGIVQLVSSLVLIKLYSSTGGIIAKSLGSLVLFMSLYIFYYRKYVIGKSEGQKIVIHEEDEISVPEMPVE